MNRRVADALSVLLILAAFGVGAWLYPSLPEQIPTHWNARGDVDGWTPKPWGAFLLPLIAVGTLVLMKLIPVISPKGFRTDEFLGVVSLFQLVLVAFETILGTVILLFAAGHDIDVSLFIMVAVGILFLILGNYLGKVRKNFFIGIRTPWTLASDEVWARTHRLGGWLFAAAGVLMIVGGFTGLPFALTVGAAVLAGLIPVVYSFLAYRRIEGFGPSGEPGDN